MSTRHMIASASLVAVLALTACASTDDDANRKACKGLVTPTEVIESGTADSATIAAQILQIRRIGERTDTEFGSTIVNLTTVFNEALKHGQEATNSDSDAVAAGSVPDVCAKLGVVLPIG